MKQENNFEVKNIDLDEMDKIAEIKDDELKQVTGGGGISIVRSDGLVIRICVLY